MPYLPINKYQLKTLVLCPNLVINCCPNWLPPHSLIRQILVVRFLPLSTLKSLFQWSSATSPLWMIQGSPFSNLSCWGKLSVKLALQTLKYTTFKLGTNQFEVKQTKPHDFSENLAQCSYSKPFWKFRFIRAITFAVARNEWGPSQCLVPENMIN